MIEGILLGERPEDGLLAEEGATSDAASGRRWVVDPLDGTTNYLYGFPAWAVSIALEDRDGGAVGVVLDPLRDELFSAVRGAGAHANGEPIEVSGRERARARRWWPRGSATTPSGARARPRRSAQLLPAVRDIRRAGAAALDLCMVAARAARRLLRARPAALGLGGGLG